MIKTELKTQQEKKQTNDPTQPQTFQQPPQQPQQPQQEPQRNEPSETQKETFLTPDSQNLSKTSSKTFEVTNDDFYDEDGSFSDQDSFEDGAIPTTSDPLKPAPPQRSFSDPDNPKKRAFKDEFKKISHFTIKSLGLPASGSSVQKKERKQQKKHYRSEQKEIYKTVKKMSFTTADTVLFSGQMKMRNSIKKWPMRYFELKPGHLVYYKAQDNAAKGHCIGIIMLKGCLVQPRPSKKPGFCFEIWNIRKYPIYSKQGLKGETIKKALIPVNADHVILRVADEKNRSDWVKHLTAAIPDYKENLSLSQKLEVSNLNKPSNAAKNGGRANVDESEETDDSFSFSDDSFEYLGPRVTELENQIESRLKDFETATKKSIELDIQRAALLIKAKVKSPSTSKFASFGGFSIIFIILLAILMYFTLHLSNELNSLRLLLDVHLTEQFAPITNDSVVV